MKLYLKLLTLFTLLLISKILADSRPAIGELIDILDNLNRSTTTKSRIQMIIKTPNYQRTMEMQITSKGLEKTFIYIISPKKNKGFSTLRIDKKMWNYMPRINKVMKIPPSMMMSSWMGSDFTNDDLVKESSMRKDYNFRYLEGKPEDDHNYYLEMIPKENTVSVWGKIVAVIDKHEKLPILQEYYDENGKRIRIMEFKNIQNFGKKRMPSIMKITSLNKKDHSTSIIYLDAKFDIKLEKDIFTLRNLQKQR